MAGPCLHWLVRYLCSALKFCKLVLLWFLWESEVVLKMFPALHSIWLYKFKNKKQNKKFKQKPYSFKNYKQMAGKWSPWVGGNLTSLLWPPLSYWGKQEAYFTSAGTYTTLVWLFIFFLVGFDWFWQMQMLCDLFSCQIRTFYFSSWKSSFPPSASGDFISHVTLQFWNANRSCRLSFLV